MTAGRQAGPHSAPPGRYPRPRPALPARRTVAALRLLLLAVVLPLLGGALPVGTAIANASAIGPSGGPLTGLPSSRSGAPSSGLSVGPEAQRPAAADPAYPYAGYLAWTVTGITPTVLTAAVGSRLQVTGSITNVSKGTIYDLRYVWQRGDPLAGVAAIKAEIATPSRPSVVIGQDWKILAAVPTTQTDLAAGASVPYIATADIGPAGLDLVQRGVYPMMIKVSGDIGQNGQTQYERVGEIHLLTTVLSVARPTVPSPTAAGTGGTTLPVPNPNSPTAPTTAPTTGTDIPTQGFPPASSGAAPPGVAAGGVSSGVPTGAASGAATAQSTAASATPAGSSAAATAGVVPRLTEPAHPIAINLVWPLVDTPHLGVGGIFLNDGLTAELKPGGRLFGVLTQLTAAGIAPSSTTLVIDPELLAELDRMAGGYRVVSQPGHPQDALVPASASAPTTPSSRAAGSGSVSDAAGPGLVGASTPAGRPAPTTRSGPRLQPGPGPIRAGTSRAGAGRPKTTSPTAPSTPTPPSTPAGGTPADKPPPNTVAGTGQAAATEFLKSLRAAAAGRQILVLPYSDPDSVAMIRAGLGDQLAQLIANGRTVAARVLRLEPASPQLITDMSMPEGGLVNDATLAFLSGQGMSTTLLSASTITHPGGAIGSVVVDETPNKGAVVRAAVTDAELLARIDELVAKGNAAGLATRLNNLAALLTGGSLDGSGTPLVVMPDNRWTADSAGLKVLGGLLGTLESGGVLTGTSLRAIAATARTPATLTYPAAAQQAELDAGYLAAVLRDTSWIGSVRSSLSRSPTFDAPMPQDILDPLSEALAAVGSAGLRTDRRVGDAILHTTESTLTNLRNGVQITGGTSYTLAASTSPLLVAVRNDLPYVVRVRVTIIGGQAVGMTATDPAVQSIPAGRTQQFKIDTKVVKAGKFVVYAQLLAADGADWSGSAPLTVNSSAYGALTIILIVVAGGALFLMVVIRIAQRIRHRNDLVGGAGKGDVVTRSVAEPDSVPAAADGSVSATERRPTELAIQNPSEHPTKHPTAERPVRPTGNPSGADASTDAPKDDHGEGRR